MEPTFLYSIFSGLTHGPDTSPVATTLGLAFLSAGTVQTLRSIYGIVGNILNLLLYTTPILTFKRIVKNKSTEEFSVVPYVAALLNSVLYTLYGSPLASNGWENVPLVTINATGVLMEISFISIFFWYATQKKRVTVALIMAPVSVFCITVTMMSIFLPDHHLRRTILGSFGFCASASMYGSPLVA
ncbi:SemiSWEET family transporter, partial [Ralstonia pseudosolanacearum]|uniref:SemiSWEET family transporter n=1 Tax=Ralstonia pseudosolanacearum TaxID=1310165 RepID=UPI003CEAC806